jgi:primosomal protein N'
MTSFYERLCTKRGDSPELQHCVQSVVDQLDEASNSERSGLLLGKIQSGKTMAFLGVIAKVFDQDYDIAIVLTKALRPLLSRQ